MAGSYGFWLRVIWAFFALVSLLNLAVAEVPGISSESPNVLLIMLDDFGAECVRAYGGTSYKTPHMDALAVGGMRFTNAYTPPLCTPTRVQIMSGQYPFRNGWPDGIWTKKRLEQNVDPRHLAIGGLMQGAGYATAVAGKWQLARFDDDPEHAARCGFHAHCLWTWKHELAGDGRTSRYWDPKIWENGRLREDIENEFGPDLYCDALIDFIRQRRDEPFFVYYPMALVHLPFVQPPESDAKGNPAKFAAMVQYADTLIGRLVWELETLGLREKTLVLVTGDNGTPRQVVSKCKGRTIRGGKGYMTEAGTRVPLIVNWPGKVSAGTICDDLVDTSDFLPTLVELAGAELPAGTEIDGRSFAPQLRGREGNPREWIYVQLKDKWLLRGKKYRLDSDGALFDMSMRYGAKRLKTPLSEEATIAKRRLEEAFEKLRGTKSL